MFSYLKELVGMARTLHDVSRTLLFKRLIDSHRNLSAVDMRSAGCAHATGTRVWNRQSAR